MARASFFSSPCSLNQLGWVAPPLSMPISCGSQNPSRATLGKRRSSRLFAKDKSSADWTKQDSEQDIVVHAPSQVTKMVHCEVRCFSGGLGSVIRRKVTFGMPSSSWPRRGPLRSGYSQLFPPGLSHGACLSPKKPPQRVKARALHSLQCFL
jgi:hypothetical protein